MRGLASVCRSCLLAAVTLATGWTNDAFAGSGVVSAPSTPSRSVTAKNPGDDPSRWDARFGQSRGCTFTSEGQSFSAVITKMAPLADGRLVIAGEFDQCAGTPAAQLAIWDGTEGRFAALGAGLPYVQNGPSVLAIAVDGNHVYVGGSFTSIGGIAARNLARYDVVTGDWSSVGTGVGGSVSALAIAGGRLYVGGGFSEAGGAAASSFARLDLASGQWSSPGGGVTGGFPGTFVNALAVDGGTVYVGGLFSSAGGVVANHVARLLPGDTWSALGTGVSNGVSGDGVQALAVAGSEVYVGGRFFNAGGVSNSPKLARWSPTTGWSVPGTIHQLGDVRDLRSDGTRVYAAGEFFQFSNGGPVYAVVAWNTGASAWENFGRAAFNVHTVLPTSGGLFIGGRFGATGGVTSNSLARYNAATQLWVPLAVGPNSGVDGVVHALVVDGDDVFVAGAFTSVGTIPAYGVARFNLSSGQWFPLGNGYRNGVAGTGMALAVTPTHVWVGGNFVSAGGEFNIGSSGVSANHVARFDRTTAQWWAPTGVGASGFTPGVESPEVRAIAVAPNGVYVGGLFDTCSGGSGGFFCSYLMRVDPVTGVASAINAANGREGVDGPVDVLRLAGGSLYVGGTFTTGFNPPVPGSVFNNVLRLSLPAEGRFVLGDFTNVGVNGPVRAIDVVGNSVYVGGSFTAAGGTANISAANIARYDAPTQPFTNGTWNAIGAGVAGEVEDLFVTNGVLHVAGALTAAGGAAVSNGALYEGTQWTPLAASAANGTDARIRAIARSGSRVIVGGDFARGGSTPSLRFGLVDARRNTTTTVATSPVASATVNTAVQLQATVTAAAFPNGLATTLDFLDGAVAVPGCSGLALTGAQETRTASCTITNLAVGTRSLRARYAGDSDNFIGTSDPVTLQVQPPAFSYTPTTLPGATFSTAGYSSGTIGVSSAAGTGVIAPVAFQVVNGAQLPPGLTATAQPNGLLITGTPTQAGTFNFTVRATDSSTTTVGGPFSSDRQYTIVVARAAQAITPITRVDAVPLDNGVAFADGNFAVQASASSALPVVIDSTTPTVCQVGAPGFTAQPLQIGTCTLRARQAGNANYEPAPDVLRTFQVKATPDVFVSSAPNPSVFPFGAAAPDPVVLSATVETPGTATPTGTVRFLRAGNTIAGCATQSLSGTGPTATATCTTTSLARGANSITAQYSGDALNVLATSNAATHQLNVGTSSGIATITPSPCVVGQGCTVAVAVAAASGTPTGSVQVGSSTGGSCTITLSAGGGSCALTATTPGSGTVSATYLGSPPWLASPAATQTHPFVATVDELFGNGFEPPSGGVR